MKTMKTMKKLLLTVALVTMSSSAFAGEGHAVEKTETETETETRKILYWVAPMDPDFRRDEPGKSPMGMDLLPVYEEDHSDTVSDDSQWLKPAETKYVCMVNNKIFDKEQIAVDVDGKTYYGCCPMCKAKLEGSQELREATDPVSGNIVDKATAIIGAGPDGTVYYFENEENFQSFASKQKKDSDH